MKRTRHVILVTALLMFSTVIFGCKVAGPSNDEVKSVVKSTFIWDKAKENEYHFNVNVTYPRGGQVANEKVDEVTIIERGVYNEQLHYYPIRLNVKGSYDASDANSNDRTKRFDRNVVIWFAKDDFGKWKSVNMEAN